MKKAANLKKRLDVLRDEPELPVEVILKLDADLHRELKQHAVQECLSTEAYILKLLSSHPEIATME